MNHHDKKFLESIPNDNIEWVAQQIITRFTDKQFKQLQASFELLNEVIYKSWARDMSFREIKEAIDLVAEPAIK